MGTDRPSRRAAWAWLSKGGSPAGPTTCECFSLFPSVSSGPHCYQLVLDSEWPGQPLTVAELLHRCSTSPPDLRLTEYSSPVFAALTVTVYSLPVGGVPTVPAAVVSSSSASLLFEMFSDGSPFWSSALVAPVYSPPCSVAKVSMAVCAVCATVFA